MATAADDGTVWTRWTRDLIDAAHRRGADPAALYAVAGIDPEGSGEARIAERAHLAAWEAAMAAIDEPGFAVEHGAAVAFDRVVLGLACKTAATVREALDRLARYLPLWNDRYLCEQRAGEGDRVQLVVQGPLGGLGRRCVNEVAVAGLMTAIRQCARADLDPRAVHFRHEAPAKTGAHERVFRAPVHFGSTWDGLELDDALLEEPLTLADPGLNQFFSDELERRAAAQPEASIEARTRAVIASALPGGAPRLEDIAAALGSSVRSLQRRLAAAGTSVAQLIDEVRREIGTAMVVSTATPLAEISFLLGFSEASAFHRAFKRWNGETPAQARAGSRGQ